jgi:nucleoside-diphosphate-sugar epimerase
VSQVSLSTLVFGCGYLGKCVAKSLVFSGQVVWATTRDPAKASSLAREGIRPLLADWCDPSTLRELPSVDRILVAVSYDRRGPQTRQESQVGGLNQLLRSIDPRSHVCYISTTGVYHQTDGDWVDEETPAKPTREGGQVHLQAENLLRSSRPGSPNTILRLSGIYGPGRVPRASDVIAGRPIASPEGGYLNLIHVEDAAQAVIASWTRSRHELYLVSDDCPVLRGEFYREIARQCGAPEPSFIPPEPNASVSARSESNKRIRNSRMKHDLLPTLRFPTYREGLKDLLGRSHA